MLAAPRVPSLATASQSAVFSSAPTTFLMFCQLADNDPRLAVKSAQLPQRKGFVCFSMMSEEETSAFLEEVKATGLAFGIWKKFQLSSNQNCTCGTATTWMTEKLHRQHFCQSQAFKRRRKCSTHFFPFCPLTSFKIVTATQYFNFPQCGIKSLWSDL